jgi:hypothetical protein
MSAHLHFESRTCACSSQALEPNEDCPIHGHPFPPRCAECGQFVRWYIREESYVDVSQQSE